MLWIINPVIPVWVYQRSDLFYIYHFVDKPKYVSYSFNLENIQSQVESIWNFYECLTLVIAASMSGLNP